MKSLITDGVYLDGGQAIESAPDHEWVMIAYEDYYGKIATESAIRGWEEGDDATPDADLARQPKSSCWYLADDVRVTPEAWRPLKEDEK